MDAYTWIIKQIERGTSNGWWEPEYAEQMIIDSGILSRTVYQNRTQLANNAIGWLINALSYGIVKGWYLQSDLNYAISKTGMSNLFGGDLVYENPIIGDNLLNA